MISSLESELIYAKIFLMNSGWVYAMYSIGQMALITLMNSDMFGSILNYT